MIIVEFSCFCVASANIRHRKTENLNLATKSPILKSGLAGHFHSRIDVLLCYTARGRHQTVSGFGLSVLCFCVYHCWQRAFGPKAVTVRLKQLPERTRAGGVCHVVPGLRRRTWRGQDLAESGRGNEMRMHEAKGTKRKQVWQRFCCTTKTKAKTATRDSANN